MKPGYLQIGLLPLTLPGSNFAKPGVTDGHGFRQRGGRFSNPLSGRGRFSEPMRQKIAVHPSLPESLLLMNNEQLIVNN